MNQQPDKFFRDKLHNYERPLSPHAWNGIAAGANQKSFLWLKVAAAITLLIVAGILIFRLQTKEQPRVITEKAAPDNSARPQTETNIAEADPEPLPSPTDYGEKSKERVIDKKRDTSLRRGKRADEDPVDVAPHTASAMALKEKEVLPEIADIQETDHVSQSASLDAPGRKTVTIVFSAEEVNEKYLTKKTVAEATPDEKEASTLQKLLDKAYDLKHNQDPVGDLRQKKNEILALNFKSAKQRSKN